MPTPINADQLESYLEGYDEKKKNNTYYKVL